MAESNERGLYLYGVTRREAAGEPLRSEGVQPGEPVEFLVQGTLAAVASPVSLSEFAPERVEARLKAGEVRWVEERALAHAAILHELMRRGPVVAEVREPMVDIFDEGDEIRVIAELPGVDEKGIQVEVKDDILTLTAQGAERKYQKEVLLPSPVKPQVQQSYRNGILEMKLKKRT